MNLILFRFALISGSVLLASCKEPPTATNTSEFREGKSGASSGTIQDPKTDNPTPYPAAGPEKTK